MDLTAQEKARIKGDTDNQDEDPLLKIARMREEEQKEIAADLSKLQAMQTEHLKRINAIKKR